jgi:hypothetical protein
MVTKSMQRGIARSLGSAACLVALVATLGGHWLALQTVAWARMVADFSQQDSLGTALVKTFSGKNPCAMCRSIRQGQQQEKQRQQKLPCAKTGKAPDFFCGARVVTIHLLTEAAPTLPPFADHFWSEFIDSPPTPPPRLT